MPLTFDEAQARQLREVQAQLLTVLQRANDQRVEAAIAAFACIRCASTLLNLYPDSTRAELLQVVVLFLYGNKGMADDDVSRLLVN